MSENAGLTEAAKAAVVSSGVMPKLKQAFSVKPDQNEDVQLEALRDKAKMAVQEIQQLINSGMLDETELKKLSAIVVRLQGAMEKGGVSAQALAAVISEATSVMGSTEISAKAELLSERMGQMWRRIEQYNKEISDDFEKMRDAGIAFDETQWKKHKELLEYLETHPQDIQHQKELNAVDDLLLKRTEPQLKDCPDAKPAFEDAKKKSEKRQKEVAEVSTAILRTEDKQSGITNDDWGSMENEDVTMNDVTPPVTAKQKPNAGKGSASAKC